MRQKFLYLIILKNTVIQGENFWNMIGQDQLSFIPISRIHLLQFSMQLARWKKFEHFRIEIGKRQIRSIVEKTKLQLLSTTICKCSPAVGCENHDMLAFIERLNDIASSGVRVKAMPAGLSVQSADASIEPHAR